MKKLNTFMILMMAFMAILVSTSMSAQVNAPLKDGAYVIQFKVTAGFIDNSGYQPGGDNPNIGIFWPQGSSFQRYTITQLNDGYYRIHNVLSDGSNISVEGSSNDDLANIMQAAWTDNDYQKWEIRDLKDGYYKVISKGNGNAWHAPDVGDFNLRNVVQSGSIDTDLQRFKFIATADSVPSGPYLSGKTYAIASEMSCMVLTEEGMGTDAGNVVQHINRGDKTQQWKLDLVEPANASVFVDYYTITNKQSGLAITLAELGGDGVNVITAPLSTDVAQRDLQLWGIGPIVGGEDAVDQVNIFAKMNEGRAIEIQGGPIPNEGQNISTWWRFENTKFWQRWQRWRFVMLDEDSSGVPSIENNNMLLQVYPNPASEYVTIRLDGKHGNGSVTLIDFSGRTIQQMPCVFNEGSNEISVKLTGIANGLYCVNVQLPNGKMLSSKVRIKN